MLQRNMSKCLPVVPRTLDPKTLFHPPPILQIAFRRLDIELLVRARAVLPRVCVFIVEELFKQSAIESQNHHHPQTDHRRRQSVRTLTK
jgi:hypothetical protein